jgi:hypothetical protein
MLMNGAAGPIDGYGLNEDRPLSYSVGTPAPGPVAVPPRASSRRRRRPPADALRFP